MRVTLERCVAFLVAFALASGAAGMVALARQATGASERPADEYLLPIAADDTISVSLGWNAGDSHGGDYAHGIDFAKPGEPAPSFQIVAARGGVVLAARDDSQARCSDAAT